MIDNTINEYDLILFESFVVKLLLTEIMVFFYFKKNIMLADFGKGSITVNSTMTFKKFLDDYFIPDYKSQVRKRTFDMTQLY